MDNKQDILDLQIENDNLKSEIESKTETIEVLSKELKKKKEQLSAVKDALENKNEDELEVEIKDNREESTK